MGKFRIEIAFFCDVEAETPEEAKLKAFEFFEDLQKAVSERWKLDLNSIRIISTEEID